MSVLTWMSNDRSSLCVPNRSSLCVHPLPPLFTRLSKQLQAALAAASVAAVVLVVQLSSPASPTTALGWGRDAFGLYNYGAPQQQVRRTTLTMCQLLRRL